MNPALLTVAEAAASLRIGRTRLYELFNLGELAYVKVGAHRRVTAAEIGRFVEANTQRMAS